LHVNIKALNIQVECESLTKFLESNMIPLKGKQFEMIKGSFFFQDVLLRAWNKRQDGITRRYG